MLKERPFLAPAFALSAALHAGLLLLGLQPLNLRLPKPERGELTVRLPPERAVAPEPAPRLTLPEPQPNATPPAPLASVKPRPAVASAPRVAPPPGDAPQRLQGEAARKATEQLARELPYPAEAIERGWQGEALVLIFLDERGDAIAARIESSSGHGILDDAAVRAARRLRSLPASAPREALLPVRFRLR
jgi:protein TonB